MRIFISIERLHNVEEIDHQEKTTYIYASEHVLLATSKFS